MNLRLLAVLTVTTVLVLAAVRADAKERIREFDADIEIAADGKITVTETIVVDAEGNKIKRGIYRDFPTMYQSRYGFTIELPFEVTGVTRDGDRESFHTKNESNGIRIYIGDEDVFLKKKTYRYEISYETNYQIGYFDTHDEFYWNVTGNGWEFPIDRARATVWVPEEIPRRQMTVEGYTGPQGSKDRNLTADIDPQTGAAVFETTRPLPPGHGLTIVVTMPKNFIRVPTAAERRELYLRANLSLAVIVAGLLVVVAYYLFAWFAVGLDPAKGTIIPLYEPPQQMSPAEVRFLRRMEYDKKCFTAAVINLAVNRVLTIEEEDGEFTLKKVNDGSNGEPASNRLTKRSLSAGENMVAKKLLSSDSLRLQSANHTRIGKAISKLGRKLEDEFHGKLFFRNLRWLIPGWILSVIAIAAGAITSGWSSLPIVGFLSLWLSFWTLGVSVLLVAVFGAWRSVLSLRSATGNRIGSVGGAMFLTLFATPFVIAELVVAGILIHLTSIWMLPLVIAVVFSNWLFWHLIKRPTDQGQQIRDEIEGFRMYLGTAEREFLRQMHPPKKTVELFEEYLPYALALDVENEWAENFKDVLAAASAPAASGSSPHRGYHPAWYHGDRWNHFSTGTFASGLGGELSTAIASSATAPGSSSGSSSFGGGGGSSGGGGGGGGGGGW